jgi:hypothetical protein
LCIPIRISLRLTTFHILLEVSDAFFNLFTWISGSQIAAQINNVESYNLAETAPFFGNETFVAPIQINQPTRCNNFSSLLLDVCLQLNMFRASSRPS